MATAEYAEWIARGRRHQIEGRPVDAMLCFRQAARAEATAPDVQFHLGEVLWQLGRLLEAIAAWREAVRLDPHFAAPAQALAEALLAVGDGATARAAADRVLVLIPGDIRAEAIAGISALMLAPDEVGSAAQRVVDALTRDAGLLSVLTLAGPLALALDRMLDMPEKSKLLDHVGRTAIATSSASAMPALLLALACERAVEPTATAGNVRALLFAAARMREYTPADHEALRRIAHAARFAEGSDEPALAQSYAKLCTTAFASTVPLLWPRRTAGARLRIVVLIPAAPIREAVTALALLAGLPRDQFDVVILIVGGSALPESLADLGNARTLPSVALSPVPDANDAKRCAAFDPDVMIDLIGRSAATGPLLARRPARLIVTLANFAASNVVPLVDRADTAIGDLARMLDELRLALPPPDEVPEIRAMAALWDDAVRTHQKGELTAAREKYAGVLALQDGYAPAHYLLGVALRDEGDLDAARAQFAAAITAAPGFVDARIAAAKAAQAAGDPGAAAALCTEGFGTTTEPLPLYRALGLALLAAHDGARATDAFAAALRFEPTDGETLYNYGVALQLQNNGADAARAYQRALVFRPDLTAAEFNLGALFQEQGATDAAIAAYRNVLNAEPASAAAYKNLGEVLLGAGRIDAWLANFRRFEANCPDALALAVQALEVCQHNGVFTEVERYLDGLRRERFRSENDVELCDNLEQLLYLLLFFDVEPSVIFRFAQTYDTVARRVYGSPIARPAQRRPGRVRVGYLSADLRNHVMGKMIWQAIRHHDGSRFALHFYSLSRERDQWTERFAEMADRFEVVAGLDERAAALIIQQDDLDLLVDLSTHTKGAKPGILALKPARVQITHIASAGTVGLSTIDFKLTDRYAEVAENQEHQLETLLPIDGCIYPYRHVAPATEHPFHRVALGVSNETVLIGAFVTPQKLSRRCLGLWREVLQRVGRALLVFSPANPVFRDAYVRLAAAAGIASDRLLFLPQGRDEAENQARYELIDFVLDPLPFGGVNGTLEALDMSVPVVALVGKRHGERVAFSILSNLGVTQTIAQSGREYVDLAVRLADDSVFMREVRAAIRMGLAGSPLTDTVAHTRALERAYLSALAVKAPEALPVESQRSNG